MYNINIKQGQLQMNDKSKQKQMAVPPTLNNSLQSQPSQSSPRRSPQKSNHINSRQINNKFLMRTVSLNPQLGRQHLQNSIQFYCTENTNPQPTQAQGDQNDKNNKQSQKEQEGVNFRIGQIENLSKQQLVQYFINKLEQQFASCKTKSNYQQSIICQYLKDKQALDQNLTSPPVHKPKIEGNDTSLGINKQEFYIKQRENYMKRQKQKQDYIQKLETIVKANQNTVSKEDIEQNVSIYSNSISSSSDFEAANVTKAFSLNQNYNSIGEKFKRLQIQNQKYCNKNELLSIKLQKVCSQLQHMKQKITNLQQCLHNQFLQNLTLKSAANFHSHNKVHQIQRFIFKIQGQDILINKLKAQIAALKDKIAQEQNGDIAKKLKQKKKENKKLSNQLIQCKENLDRVQLQKDKIQQEFNLKKLNYQKQIVGLQNFINQYRKKNNLLEKHISQIQDQLEKVNDQLKIKQQQLSILYGREKYYQKFQSKVQNKFHEQKKQMQKQCSQSIKKNLQVKNDLQKKYEENRKQLEQSQNMNYLMFSMGFHNKVKLGRDFQQFASQNRGKARKTGGRSKQKIKSKQMQNLSSSKNKKKDQSEDSSYADFQSNSFKGSDTVKGLIQTGKKKIQMQYLVPNLKWQGDWKASNFADERQQDHNMAAPSDIASKTNILTKSITMGSKQQGNYSDSRSFVQEMSNESSLATSHKLSPIGMGARILSSQKRQTKEASVVSQNLSNYQTKLPSVENPFANPNVELVTFETKNSFPRNVSPLQPQIQDHTPPRPQFQGTVLHQPYSYSETQANLNLQSSHRSFSLGNEGTMRHTVLVSQPGIRANVNSSSSGSGSFTLDSNKIPINTNYTINQAIHNNQSPINYFIEINRIKQSHPNLNSSFGSSSNGSGNKNNQGSNSSQKYQSHNNF